MMQKTQGLLWACALGLMAAPDAIAQEPLSRGTLHVNLGVQATSREIAESRTFTLYEETGTADGIREVGPGVLIDIGADVRVWNNVFVGVGYSRFSDKGNVALTAQVPDPLLFERPRSVPLDLPDLSHTEQAFHTQLLLRLPLTEKIDVTFGGGPSFYSLKQDLLDAVSVTEGATPTVAGTTTSESKSGVGFNLGADATYLVTERLGAGVFLRYAGASVDMPADGDTTRSVKLGGLQLGAGLRVRF